ncbi:hypothetical protein Pelo_18421 [Pelomyxa schiedti]|nr:hypothetical protein Pelo_18421 [Pelomyxa schiedti]
MVIDTLLMNLQCSPAKPKVSAYADDICTAWRNLKDLDTGAPTFDLYCWATGAALNFHKTEVLAVSPPLAKDKTSTAWLVQTVTKYKYLGVYIGHITASNVNCWLPISTSTPSSNTNANSKFSPHQTSGNHT